MRIYVFCYVMMLFLCSCKESAKQEIYNESNTTVINGVVYDIDEKPINGLYKVYYPDGKVKMEIMSKHGKPNGEGKFYAESGELLYSATFRKGIIDGKVYNYFADGAIRNEMNYKNGKMHGLQKTFDEDMTLAIEITYDKGKPIKGFAIINGQKIDFSAEELAKIK